MDLFSQLDHTFVEFGFMLLINILTQIGKPFHKSPWQVFVFIAFIMSIVYGILAFYIGHDVIMNVLASVAQIVLLASGFWHVALRPEGPVQTFFNKKTKK